MELQKSKKVSMYHKKHGQVKVFPCDIKNFKKDGWSIVSSGSFNQPEIDTQPAIEDLQFIKPSITQDKIQSSLEDNTESEK